MKIPIREYLATTLPGLADIPFTGSQNSRPHPGPLTIASARRLVEGCQSSSCFDQRGRLESRCGPAPAISLIPAIDFEPFHVRLQRGPLHAEPGGGAMGSAYDALRIP
jgi:hypothetical protein